MEISKSQRSLFANPSRWPPILLGLILGLFISAFFTSNFVMTRIMPARISTSTATALSHRSITASTTASINQLFIQLFLGSSDTSYAAPLQGHNFMHERQSQDLYLPPLKPEPIDSSQSHSIDSQIADANMGRLPTSKKKTASYAESKVDGIDGKTWTSSSQKQRHEYGYTDLESSRGRIPLQDHHQSSSTVITMIPKCDMSVGRWIRDDTYPLYNPGSCPFVDEGFSCHINGRPDTEYTKWRWAPRDCDVPRFNGTDMLERLRGKRMVFVGDSLNRNQWESLLCMLRETLPDKSRVVQVQGHQISKLPGAYGVKFLDHDLRVEFYASPYLVDRQEASNQIGYIIRLDKMDKSERRWRKADVLVFNTGHWWTSDKIGEGENCFQEGNEVHAKLDVMVAYNKALTTWANWVDRYINLHNASVFFRGYSPVHYVGGQWNSGGKCQNETEPIYKESYLKAYPNKMQAVESVVKGMRVPVHVLNITRLSDFRKDGHPAVFGHPPQHVVRHQDCSHWCLPGLPDTWNELMSFALFRQQARGMEH